MADRHTGGSNPRRAKESVWRGAKDRGDPGREVAAAVVVGLQRGDERGEAAARGDGGRQPLDGAVDEREVVFERSSLVSGSVDGDGGLGVGERPLDDGRAQQRLFDRGQDALWPATSSSLS